MRVTIVAPPTGVIDGVQLDKLQVGRTYNLPSTVANLLIVEGYARAEMRFGGPRQPDRLEKSPDRRWPRKEPVKALVAQIEEQPALVVDLSYGGFKLEIPWSDLPPEFQIAFPAFGVTVQARAVWRRSVSSSLWWCGAEVSGAGATVEREWRKLVDSVQAEM